MERKEENRESRGKSKGRCRPGHPIGQEVWGKFLDSRSWGDAPKIFGSSYAGMESPAPIAAEAGEKLIRMTRRYYFGVHMECREKAFADEVDKNCLLRLLTAEAVRWQVPIVDFVLLDDALHLLVCREVGSQEASGLERWYAYALAQFVRSLEKQYARYYQAQKGLQCSFKAEDQICRYADHKEAVLESCRFHYLPVEQGCVDEARIYWFSGYITIQGRFAWNFMDPTRLLMGLAKAPRKAVRSYEAMQRRYAVSWELQQDFA